MIHIFFFGLHIIHSIYSIRKNQYGLIHSIYVEESSRQFRAESVGLEPTCPVH